jgi:hypothetical protein
VEIGRERDVRGAGDCQGGDDEARRHGARLAGLRWGEVVAEEVEQLEHGGADRSDRAVVADRGGQPGQRDRLAGVAAAERPPDGGHQMRDDALQRQVQGACGLAGRLAHPHRILAAHQPGRLLAEHAAQLLVREPGLQRAADVRER